jgi:serine/threonine protein kinase
MDTLDPVPQKPTQLLSTNSSSNGTAATATSSTKASPTPTDAAWQIDYIQLENLVLIGSGSFARVYRAEWNETPVAVKKVRTEDILAGEVAQDVLDRLHREASTMVSLRHPCICQFMGLCLEPPAVVTEYCERGSLYGVLHAARMQQEQGNAALAKELTWQRRLDMLIDTAVGLLYLHNRSPAIVHRDLKAANLLLDANWRVKIGDFGLTKASLLESTACSESSTMQTLNPRWLAPETIMGSPAAASSDVFALGVVLWEVATWQLPWQGHNAMTIGMKVVQGERPTMPPRLPGESGGADFPGLARYVALMQRCWAQQPADRPGVKEVISELRGMRKMLVHAVPAKVQVEEENWCVACLNAAKSAGWAHGNS